MEGSTPAGVPANDAVTGRHGDVDVNGDLVDELARATRIRAAITAGTPEAAEAQYAAVRRLLEVAR